jgi:hypothetical protein
MIQMNAEPMPSETIACEAGRRTREGQSQAAIADELYPMIERIINELDRWLSV